MLLRSLHPSTSLLVVLLVVAEVPRPVLINPIRVPYLCR